MTLSRKAASPRASRSEITSEIADRLHSAAIHLIRRLRREDDASGLPSPHLSSLSVIVFGGPVTLGALARAEQVRPPTITRIVAALEQEELVTRVTDRIDKRVVRVHATAKGKRLLHEGRRRRVAALIRDLEALSPRQLAELRRAVSSIESVVRLRAATGSAEVRRR
jgi:DNA-binding MarR family transcriptional regulator